MLAQAVLIFLSPQRLIEEKKYAIQSSHANGLEKGEDIGKDLLSILSELCAYNTSRLQDASLS